MSFDIEEGEYIHDCGCQSLIRDKKIIIYPCCKECFTIRGAMAIAILAGYECVIAEAEE